MSLVATCPECKTAFIIKPEHLAAHRGDVRCGQCHHLFNALAHLSEAPPAESIEAEPAAPETPVEATALEAPIADELSAETEPEPDLPVEYLPLAQEADTIADIDPTLVDTTELDFVLEPDPEPESAEEAPPAAIESDESDFPALIDPDLVTAPPEPEPEPIAKLTPGPMPRVIGLESAKHKGMFLRRTPPRKRVTTWLLGVFALLLLLAAAAQTIYFLRTEIATRLPQTKPWLVQACAFAGCTIELPRQIDLLFIDDSNLQEDAEHAGIVLLTSTLINRAHFAQAYPQLELTLTDLDDHAVLRRTFAPQEYLPQGADITAGMPADGEIHVKLALSTNAIKAAGYRVFITYP